MPDRLINIDEEARTLVNKAELGLPKEVHDVNLRLHEDMQSMTAAEYGKLLNAMQQDNAQDKSENRHLPKLELFDGTNSGLPDTVALNYNTDTEARGANSGSSGGGADAGASGARGQRSNEIQKALADLPPMAPRSQPQIDLQNHK